MYAVQMEESLLAIPRMNSQEAPQVYTLITDHIIYKDIDRKVVSQFLTIAMQGSFTEGGRGWDFYDG